MQSIHPAAEIDTVRLKVRNLDNSVTFYTEVIGLNLLRQYDNIAELTADGHHALIILEANEHYRVLPGRSTSGLYHFAILLPDRVSLGLVLRNLAKHGIPVGQGDHLVSEALYLNDPDQNGIEIYADRPREAWKKDEKDEYIMATDPVDIQGLLDISEQATWSGLPAETKMGHVHFHVGNLDVAHKFYCDVLGFDVTLHFGGAALFISAGGYHHHIGLNLWAGAGAPAAPDDAVGLRYFTITLPNLDELETVVKRIEAAGVPYQRQGDHIDLFDPFHIGIRLVVTDK